MQYDFLPGGALAVEGGDEIIEGINKIGTLFQNKGASIVQTQDWHPQNDKSFASNHPGKEPGDEFHGDGIGPVLWPDHCVQGTKGAEFHEDLDKILARAIIRKGMDSEVDSYSGFRDQLKKKETGLRGFLKGLDVKRIFISGLALDYCCYYTAIDGIEFEFDVNFIVDLTRGIDDPEGSISSALEDMKSKGVKFLNKDSFY
ncbi:MAG: bifunctional nicotinamidase/pyrazinamidase [Candidatus Lokiarchaeota archaeon]|nr:bifunctional nicotinamidase/pyrazinamidase [Candidatus Lokiarchaeota archaeon]